MTRTPVARPTMILSPSCDFSASAYCWISSREWRRTWFPYAPESMKIDQGFFKAFSNCQRNQHNWLVLTIRKLPTKSGANPCSPLLPRGSTKICSSSVGYFAPTESWHFPQFIVWDKGLTRPMLALLSQRAARERCLVISHMLHIQMLRCCLATWISASSPIWLRSMGSALSTELKVPHWVSYQVASNLNSAFNATSMSSSHVIGWTRKISSLSTQFESTPYKWSFGPRLARGLAT